MLSARAAGGTPPHQSPHPRLPHVLLCLYPPPHAELRRWADVYVVAPLSANSLAKLANGLCDNLVTCVARAWDFQRPMLVSGAAGVPRNYCNPHLAN